LDLLDMDGTSPTVGLVDTERLLSQVESAVRNTGAPVSYIEEDVLFRTILQNAGPHIASDADLSALYRVGWHHESESLIIANVGAVLYCLSPRERQPYIALHQGVSVYRPGLGIEMANVALVGDVYSRPIVVRAESACSPSFLFGSQRCNCRHQWECAQELAALYNPVVTPDITEGALFERWVQGRATLSENRVEFADPGKLGFVLVHLDSQNGMGSGYTEGSFCHDLYSRASMRHRGEYSAEQVLGDSMAEAFTRIGIDPDPRGSGEGAGYQTAFIVLDFLGVSTDVTLLSNNPFKWQHSLAKRYDVKPLSMRGEINPAGQEEAVSRREEFGHGDIGEIVSFEDEMIRLTSDLNNLAGQA
jgi:GTP cyclohydrolase II